VIARGALEALTRTPLSFLRTRWPWLSLTYLLASVVPGGLELGVIMLGSSAMDAFGVALLTFVVLILLAPFITLFERWRVRLVDSQPMPAIPWRSLVRSKAVWREVGHALVMTLALWWIDLGVIVLSFGLPVTLLTAPLQPSGTGALSSSALALAGVLLLPAAAYPITAWAGARAAMSRAILNPSDTDEVKRSRARLVDAFEVERRRLERDLHDGAQQRLVALSMNLGMAKLSLDPGSEGFKAVDAAHEQAKLALRELRELIRGVHPQVLSGRGLAAAVRDAAGRSPIPIDVELSLPRLAETIEVNTYYVIAEALANIAKHSNASRGWVTGSFNTDGDGGTLRLEVGDDGVGGAVLKERSGVADRVATLDGRLWLSSPAGGPTRLTMEIPCTA
jgi:signal transduction histidine kinase